MKKKGNLTFVALVSLLAICCGAAILNLSANSKYNAKTDYERIQARYIAESGVDMATGLFINYLSNQEYALMYTKNENDDYTVIDRYSPYLLNEIRDTTEDYIKLELLENECKDYLAAVGFLDFMNKNSIEIKLTTFGDVNRLKLTQMCTQPDFLLETLKTESISENRKSKMNPIFLNISAKYKGGEVTANVKISNLYAVRRPFIPVENNEKGSVEAWIDTDSAIIEFENYQNYRGDVT
jgi:hypothetical protein